MQSKQLLSLQKYFVIKRYVLRPMEVTVNSGFIKGWWLKL
jgi:hypothetical protein